MSFQGKKLINDPNDVVTEFIEGLVETYPGLQYLDGFPEIKVVLRGDVSGPSYDKVAVISGGGSGHEPAHAGYVGPGMLTAAICGDIFASPPVDSILAGIRAVTGPKGCLLIVKNYTGDRLNFGLAAEQAKSEGYKIESVIVGDDCALPPPRGIAGRRGLAGTVLVHKVAGAAAAAGLSLVDVAAEAKRASEMVGTMGVALSVCTLPGQVTSDRLRHGKMELGLGIHGEPGAAVADIQPVDVVVSHVLNQILSMETHYVPITRGSRVVLMVNGLGATPVMELMIVARKAVPELQLEHGLAEITHLLRFQFLFHNHALSRPQELSKQGYLLEAAIEAAANEIINLKDNLNEWDSRVGDGDCGTTMYKGAAAILEDMKKHYPLNDAAETINEIGASIRRVMGGTSGIIYDIFCKAAYAKLKEGSPLSTSITAKKCKMCIHVSCISRLLYVKQCILNAGADALEASIAAVSKYGGAKAGYRTMLDALIPASAVLQERLSAGDEPSTAFLLSSEAAEAGAESTKQMQAQAGRSTYVSGEILATVPDPGAMAASAWYKAAALAVKNHPRS
ncbi:putative 3-4-dihydroxy-2-butanone kinase [Nymphaea thermarum]|nr:putative 3-4-dihydroxy-2-butanone kinase [Nymphaea thermarum]